jgi:hypothetical protein
MKNRNSLKYKFMRTKQEMSEYNKMYRYTHKTKLAELKMKWVKANLDKKANYSKKWNNKNKEYYKQWCSNNPDKSKSKLLKHRYGITLNDYNRMFIDQDGGCLICNTHSSELKHPLQIDHSHITGIVRGLLCNKCNSRLREGCIDKFKLTDELYTKAIGYITINNN